MGRCIFGLRSGIVVGLLTIGCGQAESVRQEAPMSATGFPTLSAAGVDARFDESRVNLGAAEWRTVGPAMPPRPDGDRVVYDRAGGVVEWYEATERGIEQGFTITEPVRSDLVIRGVLEAQDEPRVIPGGLAFGSLTYSELFAWDATSRPLAAAMAWDGASKTVTLSIPADTLADAVFPVTIDPLFAAQAWTTHPTDDPDAQYGWSVAGAGDVNGDGFGDVLVGAPGWDEGASNEGKVYLFYGNAAGLSTSAGWSDDPTNAAGAAFGFAVAGLGDMNGDGYDDVAVGARGIGTEAAAEGRVYLYFGASSGPGAPVVLEPTDQANAHFGAAVAGAGDVNADGYADLIVGAPDWDSPGLSNDGKAFVYRGSASGVEAVPFWENAPTAEDGARYGFAVASAGDVNGDGRSDVIVGAPNWGADDEGRAYEYTSDTEGPTPGAGATWTADPTDQLAAGFGSSVAGADSDGDGFSDVMVGAPAWDNGAATTDEGRVFRFAGGSAGLAVSATTQDPADQSDAFFGQSLAAAGDVNGDGFGDFVAGAPRWDGTVTEQGRAWLLPGTAQGPWSAFPTTNTASFFGAAVAGGVDVDGDGFGDLVVGAYQASGSVPTEGSAYVYRGYSGGLSQQVIVPGADQTGRSLDWTGDVNGDGWGDLLVGEIDRARLFYGTAAGINTTVGWTEYIEGIAFGRVVTGIGDADNDGFSDFAVSAQYESSVGRVRFYRGSASGPIAAGTLWDGLSYYEFGRGLSGGDFNGDGHGDLAVASNGAISVFAGGPSGLSASPAFSSPLPLKSTLTVAPIAGAGDLNGDGLDDLLVGVADSIVNWTAVNYYLGKRDLAALTSTLIPAPVAYTKFGDAVAGAGDVNRDGYGDVVIGAPDEGASYPGRVYVFHGTSAGVSTTVAQALSGVSAYDFGAAVAGIGDVQGDGYDDLAVGDPEGASGAGRIAVFFGSASGISPTEGWAASGYVSSKLGNALAGAGDASGDGFADLAAGAWLRNLGPFPYCCAEGSFHVYYGSDGFGLDRRMAQYQADGITRLATGGKPSGSSIVLEARATQEPGLGGMMALEFEVKRVGVPFDGTGTLRSSIVGPGLKGQATVSGLTAGASYHWRVRVLSPADLVAGHWSPYGGNTEADADFRIGAKALGQGCGDSIECSSGHCVDGVCCNDACADGVTTDCRACSIAAGASSNGVCGAVIDPSFVCRASAGVCDEAETCDGISLSCPPDGHVTEGTVCRDGADLCDVAETCTGTGPSCPVDGYAPPGTGCRAAADVCDSGEACTGASPSCPADDKQPSGTVCRAAAGVCDAEETCDGATNACPADGVKSSGTLCRGPAGVCDQQETCDGASPTCPSDRKQSRGTTCRAAAGICDAAETCDGATDSCPPDGKQSSGTICRTAADACDAQESCDGTTDACPADAKQAAGTLCRGAAGVCDAEESCDGASDACPVDGKRAAGTVCRSAAGDCDADESCDGATDACPADAFLPASSVCRSEACSNGTATPATSCTGSDAACPASAAPQSCGAYVCGPSACLTSCQSDSECAPDHRCSAGACVERFSNGTGCSNDLECRSGHCVDGTCCDVTCAGQCEACDVPTREGTCSPVYGAPHGARPACLGAGACAGSCAGDPTACAYPSSTPCAMGSCSNGVQTDPATCDGAGGCSTPARVLCGAYACGPTACLTACATDVDCVPGLVCVGAACVLPEAGSDAGDGGDGADAAGDAGSAVEAGDDADSFDGADGDSGTFSTGGAQGSTDSSTAGTGGAQSTTDSGTAGTGGAQSTTDSGTAGTGSAQSTTDSGTAGTGGAQSTGGSSGTSPGTAGTASEPPFDAGVDAGSTGAFVSNDDGGCGCTTARGSPLRGSFAALVALVLLVSRRRSVSWSFRTLRLPRRALCLRWAAATAASQAFARRTRRAMLRRPPV